MRRPREQEELQSGPTMGASSLRWVSATDSELCGDILTLSLTKRRGWCGGARGCSFNREAS